MGKKILRRDCPSKSQKANEPEAKFHSARSELKSPPCCLKIRCPGFRALCPWEDSRGRRIPPCVHSPSWLPDPSLFFVSSASNLNQDTMRLCYAISNSFHPVSCFLWHPCPPRLSIQQPEKSEKVNQIMWQPLLLLQCKTLHWLLISLWKSTLLCGSEGLAWSGPSLLLWLPSFSTVLVISKFQPHSPFFCSFNKQNPVLPQDLCTCSSLCLESSFSGWKQDWLAFVSQALVQSSSHRWGLPNPKLLLPQFTDK